MLDVTALRSAALLMVYELRAPIFAHREEDSLQFDGRQSEVGAWTEDPEPEVTVNLLTNFSETTNPSFYISCIPRPDVSS